MVLNTTVINIICVVAGVLISYIVFMSNTKKDSKNEGATAGSIASDLGYLKKGIDDINIKLEKQEEKFQVLSERVAKVEASADSAHKRIDTIEHNTKSLPQPELNSQN